MLVSGVKIREAREALKQRTRGRQGSQAWLAAQIGAHVTSISDWERGMNQPSPRHLKALAAVLGVPMESLYADSDDDEESSAMAKDLALMFERAVDRAIQKRFAKGVTA